MGTLPGEHESSQDLFGSIYHCPLGASLFACRNVVSSGTPTPRAPSDAACLLHDFQRLPGGHGQRPLQVLRNSATIRGEHRADTVGNVGVQQNLGHGACAVGEQAINQSTNQSNRIKNRVKSNQIKSNQNQINIKSNQPIRQSSKHYKLNQFP